MRIAHGSRDCHLSFKSLEISRALRFSTVSSAVLSMDSLERLLDLEELEPALRLPSLLDLLEELEDRRFLPEVEEEEEDLDRLEADFSFLPPPPPPLPLLDLVERERFFVPSCLLLERLAAGFELVLELILIGWMDG